MSVSRLPTLTILVLTGTDGTVAADPGGSRPALPSRLLDIGGETPLESTRAALSEAAGFRVNLLRTLQRRMPTEDARGFRV